MSENTSKNAQSNQNGNHGEITPSDVYKETYNHIRYYGQVRYVLLPVFLAATGAFIVKYFDDESSVSVWLLCVGGTLLSLIFFIYELAVTLNMRDSWGVIEALIERHGAGGLIASNVIPQRKCKSFISIQRMALISPYALGIFFYPAALVIAEKSESSRSGFSSCLSKVRTIADKMTLQVSGSWDIGDMSYSKEAHIVSATLNRTGSSAKYSLAYSCDDKQLLSWKEIHATPEKKEMQKIPSNADVQRCLSMSGEKTGAIDGKIGPITKSAIASYQLKHSLSVSRWPDPPTLESLRSCLLSDVAS